MMAVPPPHFCVACGRVQGHDPSFRRQLKILLKRGSFLPALFRGGLTVKALAYLCTHHGGQRIFFNWKSS